MAPQDCGFERPQSAIQSLMMTTLSTLTRAAAPDWSCRADRSAARNGHFGPSIFLEVRQARPDDWRPTGKRRTKAIS